MKNLLLPRTDGGVFAQVIVATVVLAAMLVLVRRDRDLRLLVIGLFVFAYAFFGLRALH